MRKRDRTPDPRQRTLPFFSQWWYVDETVPFFWETTYLARPRTGVGGRLRAAAERLRASRSATSSYGCLSPGTIVHVEERAERIERDLEQQMDARNRRNTAMVFGTFDTLRRRT